MFQGRSRLLLLIPAMLAMLLAMWGGLTRMGVQMELIVTPHVMHGPLMVPGFLGTVICLERVVALVAVEKRAMWLYAVPLFSGLGALALIFVTPIDIGQILLLLGSVGLLVISGVIIRYQNTLFTVTMGLGAVALAIGNLLWLTGTAIPMVTPWWVSFLVLTIAGERLELSRVMRHSQLSHRLFLAAAAVYLGGLVLTLFDFGAGVRLAGAGQIAVALWLLRYDITRRTVLQTGLSRFIAVCLLVGYVWMGVGGALGIWNGGILAGPNYDAMLHAVLLGFVFSMIFGHAPIIIPAIANMNVVYTPTFYVHLALLHLSLILRIFGDLSPSLGARQWGGVFNAVALLLFVASTVFAVVRGRGSSQEN